MIKLVLGISITSLAARWVTGTVGGAEVLALLKGISISWLAWGFIFYAGAYAARVGRFASLFRGENMHRNSLFAITGIHNTAVRLLPNPAGEAVFFYLAKYYGASGTNALAVLFVYRLFDFAVAAFLLSIAGFLVLGNGWFGAKILIALPAVLIALSPFVAAWVLRRGKKWLRLPSWALKFLDELGRLAAFGGA
ncbi:MAG: lysylphosphatidylglycerol synthase domain-containing protein, partial [Patescibacteria group bacterium]